jgi:hypothetical protein
VEAENWRRGRATGKAMSGYGASSRDERRYRCGQEATFALDDKDRQPGGDVRASRHRPQWPDDALAYRKYSLDNVR